MSTQKVTALLGIACLSAYLGYRYVTSPPGYCRDQDRYISDAEFLRATIAITYRDMNNEAVYPDGKRAKHKDAAALYKNWDFDASKPNCCLVRREETHSALNRIFGLQEIEVLLNPRTSTLPVDLGDHQVRFRWNVCGTLIDGIGLPNTQYRVITTKNIGADHGL